MMAAMARTLGRVTDGGQDGKKASAVTAAIDQEPLGSISPPPAPSDSRGSSLDRVSAEGTGAAEAEGATSREAAAGSGPGTPDGTPSAAEAEASEASTEAVPAVSVDVGAGNISTSTCTSTNKVIVLGLPWETTDASLASHFSAYGEEFIVHFFGKERKREKIQREKRRQRKAHSSKKPEKI